MTNNNKKKFIITPKEKLWQEFLENPSPEYVKFHGLEKYYYIIDGQYYLKRHLKLRATNGIDEIIAEVDQKSTKRDISN